MNKQLKRSRVLKLILMSTSPFLMTACDKPVPTVIYRDIRDCLNDGFLMEGACYSEYALAVQEHRSRAPRYLSRAECEVDFGRNECEAPDGTNSHYIPVMHGYMAAQTLHRVGVHSDSTEYDDNHLPPYFTARPLYRSADDPQTLRTADNDPVATSIGHTQTSSGFTHSSHSSGDGISRGGFGRAASSHSSWGG